MGVSWLVNVPIEDGKSTQQIVESLNLRILTLGAERIGTHLIDCDVYQSMVPMAPHVFCYLMHNSEYPVTSFSILDANLCVTSDNILDLMLLKLRPLYESRKNLRVECKGSRFELHDFVIKTGVVLMTHNNNVLGILLEVEYLPSVLARNCFALMKDMLQGLLGRSVEIPNYLKLRSDEMYSPNDTMQQYLEMFNTLKKSHLPSQQQ